MPATLPRHEFNQGEDYEFTLDFDVDVSTAELTVQIRSPLGALLVTAAIVSVSGNQAIVRFEDTATRYIAGENILAAKASIGLNQYVSQGVVYVHRNGFDSPASVPVSYLDEVAEAIELHNTDLDAHPNLLGGLRYAGSFTDASLSVEGVLIQSHNLGVIPHSIRILDASGEEYCPSEIVDLSTSIVSVDLAAFQPLQGNWTIIVGG